jgi:hypothetical protein
VRRKPGGQPGNRNSYKHGLYTAKVRAARRTAATVNRSVGAVLKLAEAAARIRQPA